ncbi:cytochrome b N-terminal domain-containing protein [bacterium]|nr:cytochrome b N-terminal domain-containing protein [bacterium]
MPKGVNWAHTLGSSLLAMILILVVTGILLSFYYSPNADAAYESVQYIEKNVLFGSVIRGVHYFAASSMVILIVLHMIRTFFYGAYKRPRHWTWIFGVVLFLLVMGFAFTGYLLPWDMKAYFATKVGIKIAGVLPLIGDAIIRVMQGGVEMGTITLSRFFSLHVVILPLLLVLAVGIHLYYIRLHGPAPPGLKDGDSVTFTNRFFPLQLFRDSVVVFVVVALIVALAVVYGAPLEAKADPNDTAYIPRPDWYFYSLFQMLKIFEGRLEIIGAVILPGAFFTLLVLLPFLDRNPERRLSSRPVAAGLGGLAVFGVLGLTAWGAYDANQAKQILAAQKETVTVEGEVEDAFVVDPNMGRQLYVELKCGECHDQPSRGENLPPGLEFAGNKYRQAWLVGYLRNPHRIRWKRKDERPIVRMPDFDLTEEEAINLTAFLMTNRQNQKFPEPEFDWTEADSEMVDSGQDLVVEYGCTGCHVITGQGQNIAPDLSRVGSKLLESYLFHLIKSPQRIIPETPMKDFQLELEDVEDMVTYLRGLR